MLDAATNLEHQIEKTLSEVRYDPKAVEIVQHLEKAGESLKPVDPSASFATAAEKAVVMMGG